MRSSKFITIALASFILSSCTTVTNTPPATVAFTIFSLNDFHGHIQDHDPVPMLVNLPNQSKIPSGGYAYLSSLLEQRRAANPNSILVGAGDLIGASPINSALLQDEPVIQALNSMQLSVTALGNHELDQGAQKFLDKIQGKCPQTGCALSNFKGANYSYIAANVIDKQSGKPWLQPYVMRQVGAVKIAFIGAITKDTPNLVAQDGIRELQFEDEAVAINRYIPEVKKLGADFIVVLIHEGGIHKATAQEKPYECTDFNGPIVAINQKIDPAVGLIVSGHTHQGYTCKLNGRLVLQGRSYGSYLSEANFVIDSKTKQIISAEAQNHLVQQATITPDLQARSLVENISQITQQIRQRPITQLQAALTRSSVASGLNGWDSSLGNVVADAQLAFAKKVGGADIAFMNSGGLRSDLPSNPSSFPVTITYGDLYATQPFDNKLIYMQLTGAQIRSLLEQQWQGRSADNPKRLYVSQGFNYRYDPKLNLQQRIVSMSLNGQAIEDKKLYAIVTNHFLADGGDAYTIFKQGINRRLLGSDIEALEDYLKSTPKLNPLNGPARVQLISP